MRKGSRVAIDGRLEWREWETSEQQKRQAVSIVADTVQFLDSPGGQRRERRAGDDRRRRDRPASAARIASSSASALAPRSGPRLLEPSSFIAGVNSGGCHLGRPARGWPQGLLFVLETALDRLWPGILANGHAVLRPQRSGRSVRVNWRAAVAVAARESTSPRQGAQSGASEHPSDRQDLRAHAYAVGREKIKEYARAVGETNPIHLDVEAARAAGYADVVAPPMFAVVYSAPSVGPPIFDPEIELNFAMMVHGGQEFEWGPLVVAGDEITTTARVKDISESDGRGYYVFESISTNQRGEQVCRGTWTNIVRGV